MDLWRKSIAAFAAAAVLSLGAYAKAEDNRASTQELPAALKALGVESSRILTNEQAESVRGEALTGQLIWQVSGPGFTSTTAVGFAGVNSVVVIASPTPQTLLGIPNSNAVFLLQ